MIRAELGLPADFDSLVLSSLIAGGALFSANGAVVFVQAASVLGCVFFLTKRKSLAKTAYVPLFLAAFLAEGASSVLLILGIILVANPTRVLVGGYAFSLEDTR